MYPNKKIILIDVVNSDISKNPEVDYANAFVFYTSTMSTGVSIMLNCFTYVFYLHSGSSTSK